MPSKRLCGVELYEIEQPVCGGSWRVVEIPVTIATPGEHTITVGTQSGTITIAE